MNIRMELKTLRIQSKKELDDFCKRIKDEPIKTWVQRVYSDLMGLQPRYQFQIEKSWIDIDIEIRVKICCLFILEAKDTYCFSEDYKAIRRM